MCSEPSESCRVPDNDALFQHYHDQEWGLPVSSDQTFFEKVCLEGFQSGLSWRTILHRRESLRQAFDQFDALAVSNYTEADITRLLLNTAIIRNRKKIASAVNNAHQCLRLQAEFGSLAAYFWQFEPDCNSRPEHITTRWLEHNPQTPESARLATDLKKRGWSFVGPVNMYALMQATGIVNDHVKDCPRRSHVEQQRTQFSRPVPGLIRVPGDT